MALTTDDDFLHDPTNEDRWWTETYWFSFDDPVRSLSGTFYPVIRRNLDIASLSVAMWAPGACAPWEVPYYRAHWHLKAPNFVGNTLQVEGLCYEVLEPLNSYRVTYHDGEVFAADLTITGLGENFVPIAAPERGHWDQPTTVQGWLELHGNRIELDCLGMRDRSWGPRLDDVSARASYVYGLSRESSFLVVTRHTANGLVSMGFLERDGVRAVLATAEVDEQRDAQNRVIGAHVRAEDSQGRTLETRGVAKNHLAKTASPGFFAWMTMMEWDIGALGQFQDVWSPDKLAELAQQNRPLT